MNSDVLIHEATMEDELELDAVAKHHSTTSQAIDVAERTQSKNLILTHFSQRYSKLPLITERFYERNVGVAFDNMTISPSQYNRLTLLLKPLEILFQEYTDLIVQRQERRILKSELLASQFAKKKKLISNA